MDKRIFRLENKMTMNINPGVADTSSYKLEDGKSHPKEKGKCRIGAIMF